MSLPKTQEMTMFEFKSGPPKPEPVAGTLRTLRAAIAGGINPTGAKTVGGGILKIFMPDDVPNMYMSDGVEVREILRKVGVDI